MLTVEDLIDLMERGPKFDVFTERARLKDGTFICRSEYVDLVDHLRNPKGRRKKNSNDHRKYIKYLLRREI